MTRTLSSLLHMFGLRLFFPISLLCHAACGDSPQPAREDAGPVSISAANYCEAIADSFCDFYVRCGRMDVASKEDCAQPFLESCNSKFEGAYVELEALGFMQLSPEGLVACEAHLESVVCAEQVFELSGPCAGIWAGQQPVGASCGLDVEFFVCNESSECVLGLDFCGTCRQLIPIGETCTPGEDTCGAEGFCDQGVCRSRTRNGEDCRAEDRCMAGSSCSEGRCQGPNFVSRGEDCDRDNRCPYLTECIGGRCEPSVLQGSQCSSTAPCATGYCDEAGLCVAPQQNGTDCANASQCRSGRCAAGQCSARPSACLE